MRQHGPDGTAGAENHGAGVLRRQAGAHRRGGRHGRGECEPAGGAGRGPELRAGGADGPRHGGRLRRGHVRRRCGGRHRGKHRPCPAPGRRAALRAGGAGVQLRRQRDRLAGAGRRHRAGDAGGLLLCGAGRHHPDHHRRRGGYHLAGADHHSGGGRGDPRAERRPAGQVQPGQKYRADQGGHPLPDRDGAGEAGQPGDHRRL